MPVPYFSSFAGPIARPLTSRLAVATEGAPPNRPENIFGFNMSDNIANATTRQPPARTRTARSRKSFTPP